MAVSKIEQAYKGGGGGKNAVVLEPTDNTPPIDNTSKISPKRVDEDVDVIVVPDNIDVVLQTPPITPPTSLNLILEDGPQYDDDGLRMKNRAGRIERNLPNQPSNQTSDGIGEIDDIRRAADELGLTGTEPIAVLDLTNPNIRFLIALYPTQVDKVLNENRILITGKKFYQKLKSDLENGNPYSYNLAFDDRFIVKLVIGEWIDLFRKMVEFESVEDVGVTMFKNIFIEVNSVIDYVQLLNYIDWFVSKPDYTNFADKGIIPSETISDYWIKDRVLELPKKVIDDAANEKIEVDSPIVNLSLVGPTTNPTPVGNVNTLSAAESSATITQTNFTGQYPPFGVAGYPGELRVTPDGRMFVWIVFNNIGNWRPYEPGSGGGAASTSGGVGASQLGDLGGNDGSSTLGGGTGGSDDGGGPGGGRPNVIP